MLNNVPFKVFIVLKNIYPCGLIMYCTTIVHKLTRHRKNRKCSTKTTPKYASMVHKSIHQHGDSLDFQLIPQKEVKLTYRCFYTRK